jgi:hypothetical protein
VALRYLVAARDDGQDAPAPARTFPLGVGVGIAAPLAGRLTVTFVAAVARCGAARLKIPARAVTSGVLAQFGFQEGAVGRGLPWGDGREGH